MNFDEIVEWFFEHYADPVEYLPYESKEGGYIPIYGPLKMTKDILYNQFHELDDEQIEECAEIIESHEYGNACNMWTPVPGPEWYGDVVISGSNNVLDEAEESFKRLRKLIGLKMILLDETQTIGSFAKEIVQDSFGISELLAKANSSVYDQDMLHLFYIKAFSIMESLLEDFIINYTKENIEDILGRIDNFPTLRDQQIRIGELIGAMDGKPEQYMNRIRSEIERRMWAYFQTILWHRSDVAKKEYRRFGFSINLNGYSESRNIRHDLIHRDGKIKDNMGNRHEINRPEIESLITEGIKLIENIRRQIENRNRD